MIPLDASGTVSSAARVRWSFLASLLVLSCQRDAATALEVDAPATVEVRCEAEPVATKLRRLTRLEWQASVKAVLGVDVELRVPDDEALGFSTVAEGQSASTTLSAKLLEASEAATAAMVLDQVSPCAVSDACAPRFLAEVGRRLFRRALDADERARLEAAYARFRRSEDEPTSFRLLTQALLQAPQFLFRLERGEGRTIDALSLATRLAFALTGEGPDEALLAAAERGELETSEGVRREAVRLLGTANARRTVGRFHLEWWGVSKLSRQERSASLDGGFPALVPAMEREVSELGAFVTLDERRLATLFSGKTTFVDPPLGALYGLLLGGTETRQVSLEGVQRVGALTSPGVLATWAKSTGSSPTLRGKFVRERLLCETLPTPPPNVSMTLPPATVGTTRQRFERHVTDPACAGCHRLIDPIGFGLERYDETGAFRLLDNGRLVDARGEITSADGGVPFEGAEPLGRWLAEEPQVQACVVRQWFRFVMGRAETDADRCTLAALTATLARTGDPRELLLELVSSDAFRLGGAP